MTRRNGLLCCLICKTLALKLTVKFLKLEKVLKLTVNFNVKPGGITLALSPQNPLSRFPAAFSERRGKSFVRKQPAAKITKGFGAPF
jgi:hypothetical protein